MYQHSSYHSVQHLVASTAYAETWTVDVVVVVAAAAAQLAAVQPADVAAVLSIGTFVVLLGAILKTDTHGMKSL